MKVRIASGIAVLGMLLGGCVSAPQAPVSLAPEAFGTGAGKVGVGMTSLPKVDTHLYGANCLLCYAAASAANSTLTTHTQTLPYEDLPKLKNAAADMLRKKGVDVIVIPEDVNIDVLPSAEVSGPNIAKKDFSVWRKKYQLDKLLVIEIDTLGMSRMYSSYIPTGDPKAVLTGKGYMVNLHNNTYEWYLPVTITKSADGNWDEPPKFPGLTNAYFQVLEQGKDNFLIPLKN